MHPTVVIAALPRELHALTRGWQPVAGQPEHVHVRRFGPHIAACAGMGADRVTLALDSALRSSHTDEVRIVSAGLAGACIGNLRAGDVLRCEVVVDARSGERFRTADSAAVPGSVLVTVSSMAGVIEKERLAATYNASLVDMEGATLGRLAEARGLPFFAFKAVSDEAGFALENLDRFTTPLGQFREQAFALHAAVRPHHWRHLVRLGRNSGKALRGLSTELHRDLAPSLH